MPGVAVIDSGNYDLKIATGFKLDAFILDDLVKGILVGYTTTTTRTNLVINPNFETGITGWTNTNINYTVAASTADAYIGTGSLLLTCNATSGLNGGAEFLNNATYRIPCAQGQTFTASAYFKNLVGTRNWRIVFFTYQTSTSTVTVESFLTGTAITNPTTWTQASSTCTLTNANSNFLEIRLGNANTGAIGDQVYCDAALIETGSTSLPYFDGTYAEPYTGYTLTEQAWNGTANASTSTATWGLTSSYIDSDYVLDGTTEFVSVMTGCIGIKVKRGRRDIGDQFSAGTMSFTLNDTLAGGVFNPFDTDSPYYDTAQSKPGLAPMREVNLIRYDTSNVAQYLFKGYVVNYDYNFALGGIDTVTVFCSDQFYLLAQTYLDEFNPSAELSGARIETVLDLPEVDFPLADRDISSGTVELGHSAAYTVPAGTNVLQYISQINSTAEFGRLFISADGKLTFQPRVGNTLSASVADFHDDGTNIPYNGVGISFEADAVVNRTVVTGLNGNTAIASDATSIATYFIQTDSITNSLLHEQTSIDTAAEYLLNGEPEARYTSVETDFLMLTTAQRDTVASIEIGNTVTVEKTFPSGTGTSELAQELSVEGIEHTISVASGHSIMLSTAPTTIVFELILDNATYGTLDELNVLG
jgi:hypothetical protein